MSVAHIFHHSKQSRQLYLVDLNKRNFFFLIERELMRMLTAGTNNDKNHS